MYLFSPTTRSLLSALDDDHSGHDPDKELQNWSSLIGIVTAIVGNVLIALALNVQRYAHLRLHRQRIHVRERAKQALKNAANGGGIYGATANPENGSGIGDGSNGSTARRDTGHDQGLHADGNAQESDPLTQSFRSEESRWGEGSEDEESKKEVSSTYLKDPYWWLGQVLITVGEMGNFLAYGFAPASIVSPLGVVALISNCVIAPIVFKEVFRTRDFWGVIIAIGGAITIVLSANTKETKLEPHDVLKAITTMEFEIYVAISCSLIAVLMWASPRYGNRTILIDLGLVGLFGGYTALSTKGVSSMLSSTLLGAFTTPVTYALILVLLSTAVMQVRYVNKALQRFDSTQVIPIQFVLFTLCVIIGSAVLYRDFERTTARQAAKFVGGCLLTFFGVFLITSGRPRHDEDEDVLSDEEGVQETIGLAEQDPAAPQTSALPSARSRRSSKASRVNFSDTVKPMTAVAESGVPSLRIPAPSNPKLVPTGAEGSEEPPLLSNPWELDASRQEQRQHLRSGTSAVSSDTVPSIHSAAVSDASAPPPQNHPPITLGSSAIDQPETPRPHTSSSRPHSHVFGGPLISPSPFSSTVSAVVADKLLSHLHTDSPLSRRIGSRRSRPSLRNSLFVPQDELDDEENEDAERERDREIVSAIEQHSRRNYYSAEDEGEEQEEGDKPYHRGFRGRARSLSNTLGDLFGVRRKRRNTNTAGETDDEQQPFIASSSRPGPQRGSESTGTI